MNWLAQKLHLVNRAFPSASLWSNALLGLVYPEWCQVCDRARATPAQGFVCEACRATVKMVKGPICSVCGSHFEGAFTGEFVCGNCLRQRPNWCFARSAALTSGAVLQAVHLFKYGRQLCVEPFLAELLLSAAVPATGRADWDCIVPVPLHPVKERERGFNQARRLARHLASALDLPLRANIVRRIAHTRTQTALSREERLQNVKRAFKARPNLPKDLRIILVDDVLTTGATTDACAKALLEAGARAVCVWTVARGN